MEIFLIKLLQFMLAISLLVLLHEGGHFFFSKLFGVRVEKFYLFFDPSLWKWKGSLFKFKPKNSDTTYGIGWLPLGGYCKISGMIDESFDVEQMKQPAQPWEFRTKPAWQRLLIMIGGVLVNFILAFVIYSMVLFTWGEETISTEKMTYGMKFNSEAKALGFRDGDILIGTDKGDFRQFNANVYRGIAAAKQVRIRRDGKEMSIEMPQKMDLLAMVKSVPPFVSPLIPAEIDSVLPQTVAERIGMMKGSRIVAFNGKIIDSWNEYGNEVGRLNDMLAGAQSREDSLKIRKVTLVFRQKPEDKHFIKAHFTMPSNLMLSVTRTHLLTYYQPEHKSYGFMASIPAGISFGMRELSGYVGDLKYLFSKEGAKSLGGFGAIGSMFPATWDWHAFWLMTAFLSIILAFMNILPIPALDGGHVLFLIYEMVTGRKPGEKFLIWAEYAGFSLLILLLIVANLNDVLRWLGIL